MDETLNISETPHFNTPIQNEISDYSGNRKFEIVSAEDASNCTKKDIARFAEIANEDLVRQVIFSNIPKDQRYSEYAAREFLRWSEDGWKNNEWFMFLIRNQEGKIAGTMTLKSNDLNGAEIGFWLSQDERGVMANAITELCSIAKNAGYRKLTAKTTRDNYKSQKVLERSGFTSKPMDDFENVWFEKDLTQL